MWPNQSMNDPYYGILSAQCSLAYTHGIVATFNFSVMVGLGAAAVTVYQILALVPNQP